MLTIIQARMSSTRLSGKVMKEVCGKPLIGHMLYRLGFAKRLGHVVVATSINQSDDVLVAYLQSLGADVFRGSEDDVLERYYLVAQKRKADHVMRLTADCPLIDPFMTDSLVETYFEKKVDYLYTGLSYAEGMGGEILTFEALEKTYRQARLRSEREHVTLYIKNHPELFNIYLLENATDDSRFRLTVDEPEDYQAVKQIFEALLPSKEGIFSIEDIKRFVDSHPGIANFNKHIIRKEGLIRSLKVDGVVDLK